MKKFTLFTAFVCLIGGLKAQDLITKIDGTVLKGKVVSFQNNKLVVLQDDETEISLNKKAISSIQFDYETNVHATSNAVTTPKSPVTKAVEERVVAASAPAPVTAPTAQIMEEPKKVEAPKEVPQAIKSPAPVVTAKSVVESPGDVSGLDTRTLLLAPKLKQTPIGSGRVAVSVCLNAEGQVLTAKFKATGSTTLNADLISLAVQNAKEFKFSKGEANECGVITYRFNLD